jgi:GNAT superfamily N-acetyltransferase
MESKLSLDIINPLSPADCEARDVMLARSLRDSALAWDYANEYPLVLDRGDTATSWCAYQFGELVAHANLWPRKLKHLSDDRTIPIGLIGNVATHPDHRGKGHMSSLLEHLATIAQTQNLQAMVLWSDLLPFYQTLGFSSIGRETRFRIGRDDRPRSTGISLFSIDKLTDLDLQSMMQSRPRLDWTLERSLEEFRSLLKIPDTHLFVRRKGLRLASWLLIGKGMDMRGVIHEWGSTSGEELLGDIQSILHDLEITELMLLAPGNLHHHWSAPFKEHSLGTTDHPMALGKGVGASGKEAIEALARGFIWGLDSI